MPGKAVTKQVDSELRGSAHSLNQPVCAQHRPSLQLPAQLAHRWHRGVRPAAAGGNQPPLRGAALQRQDPQEVSGGDAIPPSGDKVSTGYLCRMSQYEGHPVA